jgi:hypothetical protein
LEGLSFHSRDVVDDPIPRYRGQFVPHGNRMVSKMSIFGLEAFGSPEQIRSDGYRQSPSTKRVK